VRRPIPSQSIRALWALLYAAALVVVNRAVTGSWLPPPTGEGLWFYTAAVSLILGDLIVHPYFIGPKDSLSLSVAALIAVWMVVQQQSDATLLTVVVLWLCIADAVVAVVALILGRIERPRVHSAGEVAKELSTTLGHPKAVLSALFAVALVEFHVDDSRETALVALTWAILIGVQPERPIYWIWQRLRPGPTKATDFGDIAAYRTPGLLLVRHESESKVALGTFLVCRDSSGPVRLVIALDHTGREEVNHAGFIGDRLL
jgi:hypothetical protein